MITFTRWKMILKVYDYIQNLNNVKMMINVLYKILILLKIICNKINKKFKIFKFEFMFIYNYLKMITEIDTE